MSKILIVDDEISIRNVLSTSLRSLGFETREVGTASDGIEAMIDWHPGLIILDLGLPDSSGLSVLKKIREWSHVPVIVLTVDDEESTKVELLESGADDYVTKPFGIPELVARIKVALRHTQTEMATPLFESGSLKVDLAKHEVFKDGKQVHLTATELQ